MAAAAGCLTPPVEDGEIRFTDAGRLQVLVRDADGRPVEPELLTFVPRFEPAYVLDMGTETDEPGRHVHDTLLPGRYDVVVEAAGFETATVPAIVEPRGEASVQVMLERR